MLDLIATRRSLHQIPELGMEEFKTHAFLMETIENLLEDCTFAQVRTWKTGILVYLTGSAPEKRLAGGRILTVCRSWRRRAWTSSPSTQIVCTPVDMIST